MDYPYLRVNQEPKSFQLELQSITDNQRKGIYKLYYFENGHPRIIPRLFNNDKNGILYIGMTEVPLVKRVSNLQKALFVNSIGDESGPVSSGHTQMGRKYYRIRNKIKIQNLFIRIFPDDFPKKAESIELEKYVSEFAELPPLNGQYGSFDPENWAIFS